MYKIWVLRIILIYSNPFWKIFFENVLKGPFQPLCMGGDGTNMQTFKWIKDTLQFYSRGIFVRIVWRFFRNFLTVVSCCFHPKGFMTKRNQNKGFSLWLLSLYLLNTEYKLLQPPTPHALVSRAGGCLFGRFKPPQSLTSCLLTLSAGAAELKQSCCHVCRTSQWTV